MGSGRGFAIEECYQSDGNGRDENLRHFNRKANYAEFISLQGC